MRRLRGPAPGEERINADGSEGEDEQEADGDVGDPAGDVVAADVPHAAERDDAERGERREARDGRRRDGEDVDGVGGEEALLAEQLHEVDDRLEEAEGPSPVRPVAELHSPEELAFQTGALRGRGA